MSARETKGVPPEIVTRIPPDVADMLRLGGPTNLRPAFPGITGCVDYRLAVNGETAVRDCLEEARLLVGSSAQTLEAIVERCGAAGDVISGCVFMLNAACALLESLPRVTDA